MSIETSLIESFLKGFWHISLRFKQPLHYRSFNILKVCFFVGSIRRKILRVFTTRSGVLVLLIALKRSL